MPRRLSDRTVTVIAIAAVAVVVTGVLWLYVESRPHFVVSKSEMAANAPALLRTYGSFPGVGCRPAHGSEPFTFRSVCYLGTTDHFTLIFANGRDNDYMLERGVFYRPDAISPEPGSVCIRHLFGWWWEFAPIHDPDCPPGFDTFTGA